MKTIHTCRARETVKENRKQDGLSLPENVEYTKIEIIKL
jgi:hypothetical protein